MDITHGIQMIFRLTSTLEKKEGKDSVSSLSLLSLKHPLILRKSELERLVGLQVQDSKNMLLTSGE